MKYVLYLFLAAALAFAARYLFSISEWTKTADLARKADAIKVYFSSPQTPGISPNLPPQ